MNPTDKGQGTGLSQHPGDNNPHSDPTLENWRTHPMSQTLAAHGFTTATAIQQPELLYHPDETFNLAHVIPLPAPAQRLIITKQRNKISKLNRLFNQELREATEKFPNMEPNMRIEYVRRKMVAAEEKGKPAKHPPPTKQKKEKATNTHSGQQPTRWEPPSTPKQPTHSTSPPVQTQVPATTEAPTELVRALREEGLRRANQLAIVQGRPVSPRVGPDLNFIRREGTPRWLNITGGASVQVVFSYWPRADPTTPVETMVPINKASQSKLETAYMVLNAIGLHPRAVSQADPGFAWQYVVTQAASRIIHSLGPQENWGPPSERSFTLQVTLCQRYFPEGRTRISMKRRQMLWSQPWLPHVSEMQARFKRALGNADMAPLWMTDAIATERVTELQLLRDEFTPTIVIIQDYVDEITDPYTFFRMQQAGLVTMLPLDERQRWSAVTQCLGNTPREPPQRQLVQSTPGHSHLPSQSPGRPRSPEPHAPQMDEPQQPEEPTGTYNTNRGYPASNTQHPAKKRRRDPSPESPRINPETFRTDMSDHMTRVKYYQQQNTPVPSYLIPGSFTVTNDKLQNRLERSHLWFSSPDESPRYDPTLTECNPWIRTRLREREYGAGFPLVPTINHLVTLLLFSRHRFLFYEASYKIISPNPIERDYGLQYGLDNGNWFKLWLVAGAGLFTHDTQLQYRIRDAVNSTITLPQDRNKYLVEYFGGGQDILPAELQPRLEGRSTTPWFTRRWDPLILRQRLQPPSSRPLEAGDYNLIFQTPAGLAPIHSTPEGLCKTVR